MAISTHSSTDQDLNSILDALIDWRTLVQRACRKGAPTSEVLAALRSTDLADREQVARRVTSHRNCDQRVLEVIATDPHQSIRVMAARYREAPPSILEKLASDPHRSVRRAITRNPSSPVKALELLAAHRDDQTRALLAKRNRGNPEERLARANRAKKTGVAAEAGLPLEILHSLSLDHSASVRAAVAERILPKDIALRLATDSDLAVVTTIGRSPWSPLIALEAIVHDSRPEARASLAENPATPRKLLKLLVHDASEPVRVQLAFATSHVVTLKQLAKDATPDVAAALLQNPQTPPEALKTLYTGRSKEFKRSVVEHPRIGVPELRPFVIDDDAEIRSLVRSRLHKAHPSVSSVSSHLLEILLNPGQSASALHHNRLITYRWLLDAGMPSAAALTAANDSTMPLGLRLDVLKLKQLPEAILIAAANDPRREIRAAAAAHPNLPREIADQLRRDRSRVVQRAVAENPSTASPSYPDPDPAPTIHQGDPS
jgi:CheY-like chemotaxis protein